MQKKIFILGIVSIVLGALSSILCFVPLANAIKYALPLSFMGMITSSVYVFIDTQHQINTKKITLGIVGLLLSSVPVILIMILLIYKQFH